MGLRPTAGPHHTDEKKGPELYARISQETFDEAVQENIDTFDMEPAEALADAISQFDSQGINLSNIMKRVPGTDAADDPAAMVALRELKAALEAAAEADDAEEETLEMEYGGGKMKIMFMKVSPDSAVKFAEQAAALRSAVIKDKEQLALVTLNGAVDALVSSALATLEAPSALPPILEALTAVLLDP